MRSPLYRILPPPDLPCQVLERGADDVGADDVGADVVGADVVGVDVGAVCVTVTVGAGVADVVCVTVMVGTGDEE